MIRSNQRLLSVILVAGFTAGCGENPATAEDRMASAPETQELEDSSPALNGAGVATDNTLISVDAAAETATAAPASASEKTPAATVKTLPLKRGFFVASGTPCGNASNATLMLITREGINWSRDVCTFKRIEKIAASGYRVAAQCSGGETTITFEIPSDDRFTAKYENGGDSSARYCAQSNLPDPWRDNDISDLD